MKKPWTMVMVPTYWGVKSNAGRVFIKDPLEGTYPSQWPVPHNLLSLGRPEFPAEVIEAAIKEAGLAEYDGWERCAFDNIDKSGWFKKVGEAMLCVTVCSDGYRSGVEMVSENGQVFDNFYSAAVSAKIAAEIAAGETG